MAIRGSQTIPVRSSEDILQVRQTVRMLAAAEGFSLVEQTKLVTAASELARNAITHGGGGAATVEVLNDGSKTGIRLIVEDQGPGIADLALALRDGYTTGSGLGLGLGGAKRLSNEFQIESQCGKGTRVTIVRWKSAL